MLKLKSMENIIKKLSNTANLGDKRLNKRLEKTIVKLTKEIKAPITTASGDKASVKGSYRFFSNQKVNSTKIIDAHIKSLYPYLSNNQTPTRILQLSDTTEFDYTGKKGANDLGVLNYPNRKGIYSHSSLLVSDLGVPLGVFKQTHWSRDVSYLGQSAARRSFPLKDKESYRWHDHFKAGEQLCRQMPNLEWVYVADREADFMELLVARTCERMHYVIRSQYDRNLRGQEDKLRAQLSKQEVNHTYEIEIEHPQTKKKRKVQLAVKYCPVTLELYSRHPSGYVIPPTQINAIEVREVNPPLDITEPIYWILLTTLPVSTPQQARLVIQYYVWRWLIERFFYLLKTGGANVEKLQLKTQQRLENAISAYSIAAMNVMKMRYLAENQPDTPISELGITSEEHEALYTILHHKYSKKIVFDPQVIPTIREYCIALGMLGGFFASKRQPLPGFKVLTRAFDKYHLIVDFFNITRMSKN